MLKPDKLLKHAQDLEMLSIETSHVHEPLSLRGIRVRSKSGLYLGKHRPLVSIRAQDPPRQTEYSIWIQTDSLRSQDRLSSILNHNGRSHQTRVGRRRCTGHTVLYMKCIAEGGERPGDIYIKLY